MLKSSKSMIKILLASLILVAVLLPSLSFAAGPEWSTGFPKVINKNALLQWNPVKGASEYKLYRSEEGGAPKLLATSRVNKYIDKDLPSGKQFKYYVAAVVGGKEGARSSAGSAATARAKVFVPMRAPRLVGSLIKDQPNGKATVGVRWEDAAGTNLIGVNVYRSKVKGKDFILVGSSSTDSLEDTDVERGATYYYAATSVDNQFGETKYSNELKVTVPMPVAVQEEKTAKEAPPTPMRKAKLLFVIDKYKEGGQEKKLESPVGVAVDEAVGHIYIISGPYGGILVYDLNGNFQFGIKKEGVGGKGMMSSIHGIALGPDGRIYVCDLNSPEVRVFDIDGKLLQVMKVDIAAIKEKSEPSARLWDLAVDSDGRVFAADVVTSRVYVLSPQGKQLFYFGHTGKGGKLFGPGWCSFTKSGEFLITDTSAKVVKVYDRDGKYLRKISKSGDFAGELQTPSGIAVDKEDNIFVADGLSPNVQAFSGRDEFLYAVCNEKADGPIPSDVIRGIRIDSKDRLYVTQSIMDKVSVYQLDSAVTHVKPK